MMVRWSGEVQVSVRWMSGERQISIWAWHWWTWNLFSLLIDSVQNSLTRVCSFGVEWCKFITRSLSFFAIFSNDPSSGWRAQVWLWEYVQLGLRARSCFFLTFRLPGGQALHCSSACYPSLRWRVLLLSTPSRTKGREKLFLTLKGYAYAYFLCLQLLFDVCMLSILLWSTWTLSLC